MAAEVTVCKWILCLIFLPVTHAFTLAQETSLKDLLTPDESSQSVRPERVTFVKLSFTLIAVSAVDIKNEQFGVTGWWSITWEDKRLSWQNGPNLTQYSTIIAVQFMKSDIWTPAIVVDNSVNNLSAIGDASIPLRVSQNGTVTWNPAGILLTSCEMDVTYFPFDEQTCSIQVTSFGYTIQELNMSVGGTGISTKYFQENGEWILGQVRHQRNEFEEDGFTYAKLNYYVSLKRRPVYYGLNMLLPVVVNSLLIPMVFLLPHDAGEKIGYCLTVLLAYVVLLTIVSDGMPTTAKTQSLLGVYIAVVMSMSGISVVLAIHSLSIFHRSPQRRIPSWQVRLTRYALALMRLHCCSGKTASTRSVTPQQQVDQDQQAKKRRSDVLHRANSYAEKGGDAFPRRGKKPGHRLSSLTSMDMNLPPASQVVFAEDVEEEMTWQLVARAYDALFLRIYFVIIACSCCGFLFASASNQF